MVFTHLALFSFFNGAGGPAAPVATAIDFGARRSRKLEDRDPQQEIADEAARERARDEALADGMREAVRDRLRPDLTPAADLPAPPQPVLGDEIRLQTKPRTGETVALETPAAPKQDAIKRRRREEEEAVMAAIIIAENGG